MRGGAAQFVPDGAEALPVQVDRQEVILQSDLIRIVLVNQQLVTQVQVFNVRLLEVVVVPLNYDFAMIHPEADLVLLVDFDRHHLPHFIFREA